MKSGLQTILAKKLGVQPAFINQIIKGKKSPNKKRALQLAAILGADPSVFIFGKPFEIINIIEQAAKEGKL